MARVIHGRVGGLATWIVIVGLVTAACSDGGSEPVRDSTPLTTTPEAVESTSPATAPTTTGTTPPTTTTVATTTSTTTQPPRVWDGIDRLDIALLGSDAGVGRTGTRTDTIILVSVDPVSGDGAMFSVPRNLTETPLPAGMGVWNCDCFPDIITHLWANAEWYPDAFAGPQDPPVNALKAALGEIFDVEVDYYAMVDLAGFVGLIDALGGVAIDVPKRVVDSSYPHELGGTESVVIEEGPQVLDGHEGLAYARIRRNSGDFARMHRQRCLLGSLLDKTDTGGLAADLGAFSDVISEFVVTDIQPTDLVDFVELLSRIDLDRFATLRITSHKYGTTGHAGYQIYDLEQIRADAAALMADPTIHLETQDGEGWDDTCEQSFD